MKPLHLHLKRLVASRSTLALYLVLLGLVIALSATSTIWGQTTLSLHLGFVMPEFTQEGQTLFNDLDAHPLLSLHILDAKDLEGALKSQRVEAVLTLPQGPLTPLKDHTFTYTYLADNQLAPVLIDLVAAQLMPLIGKDRLKIATLRYLDDTYLDQALAAYEANQVLFEKTQSTHLILEDTLLGLKSETNHKAIDSASVMLGYGLSLHLLINLLAFASLSLEDTSATRRLTIPGLSPRLFWSQRLVHYSLLLVPWVMMLDFITKHLNLYALGSLLVLGLGSLVILFYYEFLIALNNMSPSPTTYYFTGTLGLILPALASGAFFPLDFLQNKWLQITTYFPIGLVKSGLTQVIFSGRLGQNLVKIAIGYTLVTVLLCWSNHWHYTHYTQSDRSLM